MLNDSNATEQQTVKKIKHKKKNTVKSYFKCPLQLISRLCLPAHIPKIHKPRVV